MNNKPLLSVIVPCYNVSAFLDKCLKSIVNQSYHNLEILLIDDGSTDKTREQCEAWAAKDNRIIVIHQKNAGSSATRSRGVKIARGELITFVDADDWIHPNMYRIMLDGLLSENADIAQCGVCDVWIKDGKEKLKHRKYYEITSKYTVYDRVTGVLKILDDKEWKSYMWNKIYKQSVFQNIQFPIGRGLDEDLSIMHQIFDKCQKSIYFKSELYYYLHREGSICSSIETKNLAKKIIDRGNARWERFMFTQQNPEYHTMLNKMKNIFLSVSLTSLRSVYNNPTFFPIGYAQIVHNRIMSIENEQIIFLPEYFSKIKRFEYFLYKHCFLLYKLLIRAFRLKL